MGIEELSIKQRQLLRVISELGGFAHTGNLTVETGLSNDIVGYHMSALIQKDCVERAGSVDVGAPHEAKNYKLTEAGKDLAAQLPETDDDEDTNIDATTVDELVTAVERLEKRNDKLQERFDNLKEYVATAVES